MKNTAIRETEMGGSRPVLVHDRWTAKDSNKLTRTPGQTVTRSLLIRVTGR